MGVNIRKVFVPACFLYLNKEGWEIELIKGEVGIVVKIEK